MPELIQALDHNQDNLGGCIELGRYAEAVRQGRVQEVQTTSDFSFMADTIDRGVKQGYLTEDIPAIYETIGWRRDQRTFEDAKDYEINAARLIPTVPEKGEYLPIDPTISSYTFHMRKYGCQWDVSWEAWLRDGRDLGLLQDVPSAWGLSAKYTRAYLFSGLYAANATLFAADQGNLLSAADFASGTADLTAANLAEAITTLRNFTDPAGNVAVYAGPIYLVVPSSLEFTAKAIVNSPQVQQQATVAMPVSNAMYQAAQVQVDPFLQAVDAVTGATAWYLFADPRLRPAVRYGFVAGYEQPEIFVKESSARALMGGGSDPFAGSFATDDIELKLRFTWGQGLVDWRGAVMVDGAAAGS